MKRSSRRNQPAEGPSAARRGRAAPAGEDALGHAAAALNRAGFLDATLVLRWREIAGQDIARIAEPLRLTGGPDGAVLTLKCEAGAAVFLQHQTRDLLERLASYLGPSQITGLRFVPGELARDADPPDHPALGGAASDQRPNSLTLAQALERLERRRGKAKQKAR